MKGGHGIEKNFGNNYDDYRSDEFNKYSKEIKEHKLVEKGLYMPMIIKKEHLEKINYYPEGNITENNYNKLINSNPDEFSNFKYEYCSSDEVYKFGKKCIPGDKVLIKILEMINVHHYTSFSSIVYHIQQGEMKKII